MLNIRHEQTDTENILVCEGHAGDVIAGKNLVCAAASILVMTLCEMIEEEVASNDYGFAEITCPRSDRNDVAFEFAVLGLELLAEHHPEEVYIEE